MKFHSLFGAALLPVAFIGCTPSSGPYNSPAYDPFVNRVAGECALVTVGSMTVGQILSSPDKAYFVDITTRFGNGQLLEADYLKAMASKYGTTPESLGFICITQQKFYKEYPGNPYEDNP